MIEKFERKGKFLTYHDTLWTLHIYSLKYLEISTSSSAVGNFFIQSLGRLLINFIIIRKSDDSFILYL